ncbi:MAG: hypothetical protein ACYCZN_10025 [Candidatus Dormibacteria bacterium]
MGEGAGLGLLHPAFPVRPGHPAEIDSHPDYSSERLVVCRIPALATGWARRREALLDATEADLAQVLAAVEAGRLKRSAKIWERGAR